MTPHLFRLAAALCLLLATGTARAEASVADLAFRVLLDETPIGRHAFRVTDAEDGERTVDIAADFDVRILFVPVYRYRHRNTERWEDGCLVSLRSETDDNGQDFTVRTRSTDDGLRVEGGASVEGCASSFAYWDRTFLGAERLLNSQDGSVVDVEVDALGADAFEVDDVSIAAERFRLTADEGLDISLWYTPDGRWVGLETVRDGRVVRYEPERAEALALAGEGP